MSKFVIYLSRIISYYLYFVVMACFLSLVPNINPDYPLFHFIFKYAGFYLIPPIFGFIISPMVIMTVLVLIMIGLSKIYEKFIAPNEPKVLYMSSEDFIRKVKEHQAKYIKDNSINQTEKKEKDDDSNQNS